MTSKNGYLFLIGAPKSGTTSVSMRLAQSPDICLSRLKEPCFFTDFHTRDWAGPGIDGLKSTLVHDWDAYEEMFAAKPDTFWRLDASTDYLSCEASPELIAEFAKRHPVKLVAVLRDPVARIVSEFQHTLRDALQTGTLAQSIAAEAERTANNWHPLFRHVNRSSYSTQIGRYRDLFGDDLLILDFHALNEDGSGADKVFDFIGVPSVVATAEPAHMNRSYAPRSAYLSRMMRSQGLKTALKQVIPKSLRPIIWKAVSEANQTEYRPTGTELAQLRSLLADEITACEADPLIPTDHWHLARGEKPS